MLWRVKPETPDEIAKRETKWMKRKLKLSKEQLAPVEDINYDTAAKKQEFIDNILNNGSRPKREQMTRSRQAMDLLAEEKDSRLSKVLTEKQWSTYLSKKRQLEDGGNTPSGAPGVRAGGGFPPE
ncbi:hypothetical protein [Dyadobacter sp. 32]|uniref:hypothetical protein n=1 Tax=Dyadobacter sp. 32 TaxID=538966 RepID=UPI0011ED7751